MPHLCTQSQDWLNRTKSSIHQRLDAQMDIGVDIALAQTNVIAKTY